MSDKTKRIISYGVSAVAYTVLALAVAFGWPLGWWSSAVAVAGFVLGEVLGVEWIPPKRRG
jgi:hypothetical protein